MVGTSRGCAGTALPEPFIAPTSDGGLQVEWKSSTGKELIIEVPPDEGPSGFLLIEPLPSGEEHETEGTLGQHYSLRALMLRLSD